MIRCYRCIFIMVAATQDKIEEYGCQLLSLIKEKPVTDLVNQLDIADGLKGVLISSGFTLKSLLNASASDFAILGIDPYVAMLVSNAIKNYKTLAFFIVTCSNRSISRIASFKTTSRQNIFSSSKIMRFVRNRNLSLFGIHPASISMMC